MTAVEQFIEKYGDLRKLKGNTYHGSIDLRDTDASAVPSGLTINGTLSLGGMTTIPSELTVNVLDLSHSSLTALPTGLTVKKWLNLENTKIATLPENLTVGLSLKFRKRQFKALPTGLTIGGAFTHFNGMQITELPEGLVVRGHLYLHNANITTLPSELAVGGDLLLNGSKISTLPEGLKVGGSLHLEGTQVTELPEGLVVGRNLHLEGTQITELPESISVGGKVYMNGEEIDRGDSVQGMTWDIQGVQYIQADGIMSRIVHTREDVYEVEDIINKDTAYLVTNGEGTFAHGKTLRKATEALQAKMLHAKPIAERLAEFVKNFAWGVKYPAIDFFEWHNFLTGSCEYGRRSFVQQNNINLDVDTFTVEEFIDLTEGYYGGDIIAQLEDAYGK